MYQQNSEEKTMSSAEQTINRQEQRVSRTEQRITRQVTSQQRVEGNMVERMPLNIRPGDPSPPIFEQIFKNARFAQGGNAKFEGKLRGNPKPVVSWTRKKAPLVECNKYSMSYNEQTGNVSLVIKQIGPGDEGEYTCTARNKYGEAICSVYIQPEGMIMPAGPASMQRDFQETVETSEHKTIGSQVRSSYEKVQKTAYSNGSTFSSSEDFKVDTFEYRLLREVSFRESITRRQFGETDMQIITEVDRLAGPPAPPKISQKPRNSKLQEGADAVFQVQISANPRSRVTWFKNGQRIINSSKHQISTTNNQTMLKINKTHHSDTGHYTLLAENPNGCVVTSAYLAIETPQESFNQDQRVQESTHVEIEERSETTEKALAPQFVRVCQDRDVTEGKLTRFDCRVTGRPYPEVTWYINGQHIQDDFNHKILVNESGNHALMITNIERQDCGVVTCVARNKSGETSFQCNLNVIEKEQVVAPKFVERFTTLNIKEGEPVILNARAVGTPTPRITWQKDGVPITPNPELRISTEGGASTLDIQRAKASDAAWYQCTAQNVAGSTATRARLFVETPKGPAPEQKRLHLPRPTKIIQPEPAPGPEIIYLRHVERAKPYAPPGDEDRVYPPPQFIIPLQNASQIEGGKIHFETRIEPVGDPTMQVQWFRNGQSLEASSRTTSTFKFGYIALDLLSLIINDSGEYTCRVISSTGVAETQAFLQVTPRASIEKTSQHPDSLQYIQQLEDYSKYQHMESVDEQATHRPQFIRPLQELGELQEGRNAHFEAQLTPVSDPTMRVEWYKDGKAITASSRITTIFNFGYVSLNIMHLRAEDAGSYTVRAINRLGEAISTASLRVISRSTVTGDLGIPEQQRYIEEVERLEAYQQQHHQKYVQEVPESVAHPEFKTPIKDQLNIREGGFAHFEARLEPIGDSTLRVEWLKDGRPVEASSRTTTFFNFGYVALTIKYVTIHDIGRYSCRAYNKIGQAVTEANLSVITKKDIILETQHPGGLEKIQHLEDANRMTRTISEDVKVVQKPRFLGILKGTNKIVEGQRAHFEARVEPQSDLTMTVEWYFNGNLIKSANRIQTYHDFGYVALDIASVRGEDAGTYTVVARNASGEAQLSASMVVQTRSSIDTSSIHKGLYEKTKVLESSKFVEPQYHIEEISKSKPIFVQPLSDPNPVSEGKNIHLECRLEPMGDPTMRVEWYQNGRAVTVGSRFRTYYDFGFVALDIIHATSVDSGEYTARAVNHLGSAHTSAIVRVIEKSDILTDTQNEQAIEQIQMLEDASRKTRQTADDITVMQAPQFSRSLHNIEIIEGTNVHMECRLQPIGDPTMRVEWFCNGRAIKTGHRFRPAYDFDYVALDLLSVYPEDSGVYTCQARNQLGEAVTSCALRVHAKKDLLLESQHPSGLEKIQYLEDASRYKKNEFIDEIMTEKPRFVTKPKSLENMMESQHVHFECKLEPVTDSNLKVEWFKNGRPVTIGHRFRPIHDFGYVALDIVDLIAEDTGVYTCRAVNLVGMDEVTCTLSCRGTAEIMRNTQNEAGLEQIQMLEDRSRYQRTDAIDEITKQVPIFTTSLKNVEIKEGQRAHFECRLIPVSDPTMKVEWYHNNTSLKSGSRFTETNNFGFVALDIMSCLPEDSGTYTCRAINALGEAVTSGISVVQSRKSIYLDSQHESALNRLSQLEDTSRYQRQTAQEDVVTQAPVFTLPVKDLRVAENQAAHFEARLIPVGDPKLKVEWLRNGVPIEASNRLTTMHDFGYVALNMKYVNPEDSGTYTCRAINELGQAVTSSTLFVQSKASLQLESQHESALEKINQLEDSSKYQRRQEEDMVVKQAPRFVTQLNGPANLIEGHSAHYECRIEPYPDPDLKVEWLLNGKPLQSGHRYRTTYDFGFASLDVLSVYAEDSGEYTCRAINKLGKAQSSIKLNVQSKASIIRDTQHESALEKIQYLEDGSRFRRAEKDDSFVAEKPEFGRPLKNVQVNEGKPVHLEATLTPVNDPTMRIEWYCNGRPIQQGHRFKTTYDFGFVALDILYAYGEDTGTYMCKAINAVGEAVTTSSVKVDAKAGLYLDTLDEQRLKKIRELENYERPQKVDEEKPGQRPVFITALTSLENLKESDRAHFECRVEPINDPDLKIEWFLNGNLIRAGHRYRTTHDFGYVAMDILYAYSEDSGTYMCKATNKLGEAVNTCTLKVASHRSIVFDTQHPVGLEKIRLLEAQGRPSRLEVEDPPVGPPKIITELRGTTHVFEGQAAHFECQVEPVHDPNLRIEFYHNGKALQSASRFHITFDFGYVSLDIQHVVPEDAGEYSVKAINAFGQCTSAISMTVTAKGSIISESQRPEGLEKIRELESNEPFKRPEVTDPVTRQRPVFTQPLQNIDNILESQTAHFDCRLIPVGDPTLKVEWYRNEKLLEDSSRITKTHDFGFVSMTIAHVREEDEGVYICRASNALGEAVTTAAMKIKSKASIQLETQHPEGMKKILRLEEAHPERAEEPEQKFEKPIFTQVLTGPSELWEGQHAHYEARVVPVGDPSLRFEWFINGVELKMGSRFRTTHDFGFVTLDINSVITDDSGLYMCKAINNAGSTVSSISLKVKSKSTIVDDSQRPESWQQIQLKEAARNRVPDMFVDTAPSQAPIFTTHLKSYDKLIEGQHVFLEAQVEPRTDPNLRIEWFKNGISLTTGSRLKSTFDFGLVTLSINGLREDDSGIYTCKATNLLGEAVSTASIKIEDRHWLLGDTLHPESLDRIGSLEQPKTSKPESQEPAYESPVFITHLNNIVCKEADNIHFECNVEPSRDPTLKIEWFVNGKPLPSGSRYKTTHDFGYVSLDVSHTYEEDSGIYTCKATNTKGTASTSGTLRCTAGENIFLQTQHPQGKAGLDAVHDTEDAIANKNARKSSLPDAEFDKPVWVIPFTSEIELVEANALHLEGQVEPKNDPNLKIEWYLNGKVLEHGSRFKMTSDFGFVTLDVTDIYERDSGIYTCKAFNKRGEAFTSSSISCITKENLIERTQHPKGAQGLEKIQNLEDSLKKPEDRDVDIDAGRAPEFTSVFQDLTDVNEGQIAHFEASLIPTGDQSMVIEWFYNGKTIEASHRVRTVYAFGMVVLEILGTKIEDSGKYSCRATNRWGTAEISVNLECVDKTKGQKPKFTTQIQNLEGLKDGQSSHFECTLIPVDDPDMIVEWFHNGQPLRHSTRIKMVSDFGFVLMDIAYVQSHDSGVYVCKATNKYGSDTTTGSIKCFGKGGVYLDSLQPDSLAKIRELESLQGQQAQSPAAPSSQPPKFLTQIADITKLVEGQSAHFEARLIPVDDPDLVVEWFYNGKKLPHGHRYRTFHDFGIVILDILYCYEENSGTYECIATNKLGRDSTKAVLKCLSKENLILDSQLPKGMEGGLEKLQTLEDAMIKNKDEKTVEEKGKAPVFTVPFSNLENMREGENAHFEARLTPTDDPKLKVEWFWNGKSLRTGSRFRTFCDFGFVILEISPVYPEDSGEYSCRAINNYGQAVTVASMKVQGKRNIILESQLPKGMEGTIDKIAALEGLSGAPGPQSPEEDIGNPPEFITTPADLVLGENSLAHFECRLTPVNDPSMRVEWFHNGKALLTGSRIKTINDFGFVILEVAGVYQRDSGLYTCKATNKHGEATVSCKLQVRGRQGIILEPQLPSNFKTGTESIQKLEETLHKREEIATEEEKPDPPRFTVEIKDNIDVPEGGPVHFDCRVEPVGDPTMRIDWFHNGRPFATGSRVHMLNDFGFIALDIDYTYARDSGEYVCRATNRWGFAETKATVTSTSKRDIVLDSQLPQGMSGEKIKELERGPMSEIPKEEPVMGPPKFITQIQSHTVEESEAIRFECRVEPKEDPNLRIEWYRNGKPLPSGHRYRTVYDMGFVSLDILYVYAEDSGEYTCRAFNKYGEDFTRATVSCKELPSIILQNQVPRGMKKSETLMQMEATIKKYTSEIFLTEDDLYDPDRKQPPRFVTQIQNQEDLVEMQATKFECQLAPVGDPNMKVEWFLNGKPLPYKNRFTPIYDFGYVAMNFGWVYPEDSGEYLCRATNLWGMDETRAIIKTAGKPGIIYDSQLPKHMKSIEKIRQMEALWQVVPEDVTDDSKPRTAPVFVSKPEPATVEEGEWARFCCRVTGHPKPRVMWLVNGNTVVNGSRYKLTYDGMYHMDIPKTRQYDTGKIEVIARSSAGQAVATTELKVIPRHDDYRGVLKNSPRRILGTKEYRKPEWVTHMEELQAALKATQSIPTFVKEILGVRAKEEEVVTFDCQYSGNPMPDIIWYHDDKIILNDENTKIRIKDNKTSVTIHKARKVDEGVYVCKAMSDIGMAITKAKLQVSSTDEKPKEKKAKEQKMKLEKVKKNITEEVTEETVVENITDNEKIVADKRDVQVVESTVEIEEIEEVKKGKAKRIVPIQESVGTTDVATFKKVDKKTKVQPEEELAKMLIQPHKHIITSIVQDDEITEDILCETVERVIGNVKRSEIRQYMASEISEILEMINAKSFGPGENPLKDLAKIGFMVRNGVSVQEIISLYNSSHFPALKTPQSQSALVLAVERQGFESLITEVMTEETVQDETTLASMVGFRAFMKMVEQKHASVEEVIVQFCPEDFTSQDWERKQITPKTVESIETQYAIEEEKNIKMDKKKIIKEKRKIQELTKEAASMSISREANVNQDVGDMDIREGDIVFAVYSYVAETPEAINLVEGERLYILETHNQDWWFVKKHLTEEKGWVPAQYLMDEGNYTVYLQKKLNEKIDKLPVFEKPSAEETAVAPRFVEKLRPKHTPDGYTVQFECQVEGYPRPQITWFRQTAIIKPSQDFQIYYDDDNVATLIIREVFPEDAGTFTCVAKNAAGFASSTTELVVEAPLSDHGSEMTILSRKSLSRESSLADILEGIPPTFSKKPKAQYVDEGTQIFLECRLVAVPEPEITWLYAGKKIVPNDRVSIATESDMHMYCSVLKINNVKKTDEGIYEVAAINREGEASLPIMLKIKTGTKEKPEVIEPFTNLTIREGESVVLTTQIVGNPTPKISWFKNKKAIKTLNTKSEGDTHTLTLINPKKGTDDGVYTVKAVNSEGSAETSAVLTIEEPTQENCEPPLFIERFQEISVPERKTIVLTAKVIGNPVPTVTWLRNNKSLEPSSRVNLQFDGENIALKIENADSEVDSGDYKCIASNLAGKICHGAKVTVDVEKVTFVKNLNKTYEVDECESVVLECETSHTVSTKWYQNDKEISGMDHREIIQEGRVHKLRIKKTKITDTGKIKCIVKGQETNTQLVVKETIPEFTRKLQDFEVKEKEVAILEVEISSETADVVWQKDGKAIKYKQKKYEFENKGNLRKLLIRNTSVHDEGEYSCILRDQTCSAEVTVVELPPEITSRMKDTKISKGEKATFEIELTKGDALVRWFKNGTEIQFSDHIQLSIDGKKQKLKIYDSTVEDMGEYSCKVGNDVCVANLTVEDLTADFILKLPETVRAPANTDVSLTVQVPREDLDVQWYKNGIQMYPSDSYVITSCNLERKLVIPKVTENDQCNYTCKLNNIETTCKLIIEVVESPPKILEYDKIYRVIYGEDVTFNVRYSSTPQPKDEWTTSGKVLKKDSRTKIAMQEECASLTLKKLVRSDTGLYKLRLTNNCGETQAEIQLNVLETPDKPGTPESLEVGEDFVTLHWKQPDFDGNSQPLTYSLEYRLKRDKTWNTVTDIKNMSYTIRKLETDTYYVFRVIAHNEVGASKPSDESAEILIKKSIVNEAPSVQQPLKDITTTFEKEIILSCVFGGVPLPTVDWYKDGKIIKKNISYENRIASLSIHKTSEETIGQYTCKATNILGFIETKCNLTIEEKPKITVEDHLISQKLNVGSQWHVVAKINGYPKPNTKWLKNNNSFKNEKDIEVSYEEQNSTISIKTTKRSHSGKYTIEAENFVGRDVLELSLRVCDKPSKPEGPVVVKGIDSESVMIQWSPPVDDGGIELTKYAIEKRDPEKQMWTRVADVDKDVKTYCIQKLNENCEYLFRVMAQNPVGYSEALESDPVVIRPVHATPSAPQNVCITETTSRSATVQWTQPLIDGGSPILGYMLEQKIASSETWIKVATIEANILEYRFEKLKEKSDVMFRITAENAIGLGLPGMSEVINLHKHATVPSAPTAPLEIRSTGPNSIIIEWGQPEFDGGVPLQGYNIAIRDTRKTMWMEVGRVSATTQKFNIRDLQEDHHYLIRIFARNEVGLSDPLESEEPFKVIVCQDLLNTEEANELTEMTEPTGFSTETSTSWMREANMDADIRSYARGSLLRRDEYFFRIWHYAKQLFK